MHNLKQLFIVPFVSSLMLMLLGSSLNLLGTTHAQEPLPDLMVEALTITVPNPEVGQPVTISMQIKNSGPLTVAGRRAYLYIDPPDQPPLSSTLPTRELIVASITWPPGDSMIGQLGNYRFDTPGEHVIYAWVDPLERIAESNERNNLMVLTVSVRDPMLPSPTPSPTSMPTDTPAPPSPTPSPTSMPTDTPAQPSPTPSPTSMPMPTPTMAPLPDLMVESLTSTELEPRVGQPITISMQIKNSGSLTVAGRRAYLYIDPPDQPPLSSTLPTRELIVAGIVWPPSVAMTGQLGNYRFDTPGEHVIYAWVDPLERIAESDESNNLKHLRFIVRAQSPTTLYLPLIIKPVPPPFDVPLDASGE